MSINIHKAVLFLYTNAVHITGNDVDSLIVLDKNNNQITISPEQVIAQVIALETQYAEQQQAQANAKASAIAKLTALGLSAEEISAIGA